MSDSHIVSLNVGGREYSTSINTLTTFPDSMLGCMFNGKIPSTKDTKGRYFIDANGAMFEYILDYLRRNQLLVPDGFKKFDLLLAEAEFYQIEPLINELHAMKESKKDMISSQTVLLCGDSQGQTYHAHFQNRGVFHSITGKSIKASFDDYRVIIGQQGYRLVKGPDLIDKENFYVWLANMYAWGVLGDCGEQIKCDVHCDTYEVWSK